MRQLRGVSIAIAIVASVFAMGSGIVLFFVVEPPFLVSIFVASGAIAVGCFLLAGIAAYYWPD